MKIIKETASNLPRNIPGQVETRRTLFLVTTTAINRIGMKKQEIGADQTNRPPTG